MLPPGHIAAGYLVADTLIKVTHPELTSTQVNHLLWWGIFWGFAPDFDSFAAFLKVKAWWYKPGTDNTIHRRFYTHVPILWLAAGLIVYLFAGSTYGQLMGLLIWLGSWSHFLLDSIDYGIEWLWPFSKQVWAFRNRGIKTAVPATGFWNYWWTWYISYTKRATFYIEILILALALINILK